MKNEYTPPVNGERLTQRFQAYAAFEQRVKDVIFAQEFSYLQHHAPSDELINTVVGNDTLLSHAARIGIKKFFANERAITSWAKEEWFGEDASLLAKQHFFEQLGLCPQEEVADIARQSTISRIPGGIACTVSPDVMQQLIVGKIHTPEKEITQELEIRDMLSQHATVGFLLEKNVLEKSTIDPTVQDGLHVVFVQDGPGKKRAVDHEINEILSNYLMDSTRALGMDFDKDIALGLHDLAARIETGESIEGIGLGTLGISRAYFDDQTHIDSLKGLHTLLLAASERIQEIEDSSLIPEQGKYAAIQQIARSIRVCTVEPRNLLASWGKEVDLRESTPSEVIFFGEHKTPVLEAKLPGRFVFSKPTLQAARGGEQLINGVNAVAFPGTRYKISRQINQGGMGVVYAGELVSGNGPRQVAIKEMLYGLPEAFFAGGNSGKAFVDAWLEEKRKKRLSSNPKMFLSDILNTCQDEQVGKALYTQIRSTMQQTGISITVRGRSIRLSDYVFDSPQLDEAVLNQAFGNNQTIRSVIFGSITQGIQEFAAKQIGQLYREDLDGLKGAFLREHAMMQLFQDIPNVPRVYGDVLKAEAPDAPGSRIKNHFYVMELFTSPSLDRLKGRVTPEQMVTYMLELLGALSIVHNSGAVHHDIKPGNILIENGQVKILDFGAAIAKKDSHAYRRLLSQGIETKYDFIATPSYCPPDAHNFVSSTTDLYAVGKMLEEFIPANSRTPMLSRLITKAIKPLRENRYQSAIDMRNDLQNALNEMRKPQQAPMLQRRNVIQQPAPQWQVPFVPAPQPVNPIIVYRKQMPRDEFLQRLKDEPEKLLNELLRQQGL